MLAKPLMFLEFCILTDEYVGQLEHAMLDYCSHSTYCGKVVTLASQFEVTEESFYGIRIPEFGTVGALKVKASSSALITCYNSLAPIIFLVHKLVSSGGYTARPLS